MKILGGNQRKIPLAAAGFFVMATSAALADEASKAQVNGADTAFMLACTALVLLMTPGLALFYGGIVRRKNVLGTIMHSFVAVAVISLQWVLFGYGLAFGPDHGHVIGSLSWVGLRHVGMDPIGAIAGLQVGGTIPHQVFIIYQCMFAIITPALIAGAMAERVRFKTYVVFILLWSTLVYDPICHWVWHGDGWLFRLGALDFAGGTVVHISSGFTALVVALMLGRRKGFPEESIMPHDLPLTILGAGILWFGWFGFNAGSALKANDTAVVAFVATNTAGASAAVTWMLLDWFSYRKPTALGAASGAIAGLATVTPASGFVSPLAALAIGVLASVFCRWVVQWRTRRRIDDSLDAFGVHGIGGLTGTLAAGIFASVGAKGLLAGNPKQLLVQAIASAATLVYAVAVSFVLLKVLDLTMGLRIDSREEFEGLDLSQHGETGYGE